MYILAILSLITITNVKSQNNGFAQETYSPGVSITVQVVGDETTIEMCGPVTKWFGIGFDSTTMEGAYAIIACPNLENSLDVEERTLGNPFFSTPEGTLAPTSISVVAVTTVDDNKLCAVLTRKTEDSLSAYDFPNIFNTTSVTDVIVAVGLSEKFANMDSNRAISTLSYTIGTMDPATQPTEAPLQPVLPHTASEISTGSCATYISLFDGAYDMSWDIVATYIEFNIVLTIDAASSGWVGIGFGAGEFMHGQDIIKINFERDTNASNGGIFFAEDSYSSGWFPESDTERGGSDNVFDFSGQFIDNFAVFNFKRPLIASDEWDYPILDGSQYFIVAFQLNCFDCKHDSNHRLAGLVDWYTGKTNTNLNDFDKVRLYHGLTMIFLFGLIYPTSAFVARYLRHTLWWKDAHKKIGSLGIMTSLTSAYFAVSTTASGTYSKHGLLGTSCVALLCFQFGGGYGVQYWFQNWKRTEWYNRIHYFHLLFAILLNFLAPVTIWYGWMRLQPFDIPILQSLPVWFSPLVSLIFIGEMYKRYYPKWSKNSEYSAFESNYHVFTWDEIGEKVSAGAAWIIVDKYVLDVTIWQLCHPGGRKMLLDHTGTDCTDLFHGKKAPDGLQKYVHSEWAKKQMATMIVGEVPSQSQKISPRGFTNRNFSKFVNAVDIAPSDSDGDEETDNVGFDHHKLDAFLDNPEIDQLIHLIDNISDDEAAAAEAAEAKKMRMISKQMLLKHKSHGLTISDLAAKTQKVSDAKRFRIVKLLSKTKMSAADCSRPVVLLEFDIDARTMFCAGDYVLLHDTGKQTVSRAYTPINPHFILCNNGTRLKEEKLAAKNQQKSCLQCFTRRPKPRERGRLFLLVRLYKHGRMSLIINSLRINNSLRLTGPFERKQLLAPINFGFGRQCWRRIVLICGGTGVTPMINALHHHLTYGTDTCRVLLVWYNKSTSDVACIGHLKYLKSRYPKRFWIDLIFSEHEQNTDQSIEPKLTEFAQIHAYKWNETKALFRIRSFLINGYGVSRMQHFVSKRGCSTMDKQSKLIKTSRHLGELETSRGSEESLQIETSAPDPDINHNDEIQLSQHNTSSMTNDEKMLSQVLDDNGTDFSMTLEDKEENKVDDDPEIEIEGEVHVNIDIPVPDMGRMGSINDTAFDIIQKRKCDAGGCRVEKLSPFDRIILSGPKPFVERFSEWLKAADDLSKLNIQQQIIALD